MIEVSTLRDLIFVDEKTGALSWKERPAVFFKDSGGRYTPERAAKIWNSRYSGTPAKHVGSFLTIDEAVIARKAAGKENMFHENHGRKM